MRVYLCLPLSGLTCNWLYAFTYAYNLAKSGGKKKKIHKCCNHKWTGTVRCRNFQEPAGLGLGTPKVCFWYIQADDESNDDNKSIAESSSEEEMEVGETSQIGN